MYTAWNFRREALGPLLAAGGGPALAAAAGELALTQKVGEVGWGVATAHPKVRPAQRSFLPPAFAPRSRVRSWALPAGPVAQPQELRGLAPPQVGGGPPLQQPGGRAGAGGPAAAGEEREVINKVVVLWRSCVFF